MTINVGIIGCGSITQQRHAPEYHENKACRIAAFSDPVVERARKLADKYSCEAYQDYREIINNPSIHAVSVCSTNSTHAPIAVAALKAGKHVLCEKPMAVSTAEAEMMIRAAEENRKILMPGHSQRMLAAHRKAKEILASGTLGKVLTFRSVFKHRGPETWSADRGSLTWFFDKKSACMGVLGDLGVHKIDILHWLLAEPIISVSACMETLDKRYPDGELIGVEDNTLIQCSTSGGKKGTIEVSWTNYGTEDNSTIFLCEKGVLKIFCDSQYSLVLEMKDRSVVKYELGVISTNDKQLRSGVIDAFISSIVTDGVPEMTGEDGYHAIAVVEACMRSAASRSWEEVLGRSF